MLVGFSFSQLFSWDAKGAALFYATVLLFSGVRLKRIVEIGITSVEYIVQMGVSQVGRGQQVGIGTQVWGRQGLRRAGGRSGCLSQEPSEYSEERGGGFEVVFR